MRLEENFLVGANARPSALAVVSGEDRRSYGEVHDQAASLAGLLATVVPTGARVGIVADRGPDACVWILATLLAGAAYVPINPHHPERRIRRTIQLAELDALVVDEVGLATVNGIDLDLPPIIGPELSTGGGVVLGRDAVAAARPIHRHDDRPDADGDDPDETAYLLFTSGSTGDPKGVPISHGNVAAFLADNHRHHGLNPDDRCSQAFDLTFDLSVFDLFMTWRAGACLHQLSATDLLSAHQAVAHHRLTVWFSVPSVAALLIQRGALRPGAMPTLRQSLFCGEALTTEVARAWADAAPNSTIENLYGPTELTIACTRHRYEPSGSHRPPSTATPGLVPIGQPFDHLAAVVLDGERRAEPGSAGELCVTGPQRFAGYWRNAAQTAAATVTIDGVDHYRTGDRVVLDDDGILHFVGRLDNQIQVMGHRVELGEVEAGLRSIDGVVDAVAFGLPLNGPAATSVGAAVTVTDDADLDPRAIRRAAAEALPSSMAPRRIAVVDAMPLNANGKIDRRALADTLAATEAW